MGSFVLPFLSLYLTTVRHVPLLEVGAVLSAFGIGSLAAPVVGGILADRLGRKLIITVSLVSSGALLIPVYFAPNTDVLWAAVLVYGFALGLGRPAETAMVADLIDVAHRRHAYALLFWATNLGFAIAMVAAGFLVSHHASLMFLADGSSCVVGALVVLAGTHDSTRRLRRVASNAPAPRDSLSLAPPSSGANDVRPPGLRTALRDPLLMGITLLALAYATLYQQASVTLPLAMVRSGLSPAAYGIDIAVNGVLIVVLQPLLSRFVNRVGRMQLLSASTLVVGIGFASSALAHSTLGYGASVVVWSIGEVGTAGILSSVVADIAPRSARARYAGVQNSSWGVARLVAPICGIAVLHAWGSAWLFVACGIDGTVCAAGYLALTRPLGRRLQRDRQGRLRAPTSNEWRH